MQLNGEPYFLEEQISVAQLIEKLALGDKRVAVELNGSIVPRSQYAQTLLTTEDTMEIVTAIGGG